MSFHTHLFFVAFVVIISTALCHSTTPQKTSLQGPIYEQATFLKTDFLQGQRRYVDRTREVEGNQLVELRNSHVENPNGKDWGETSTLGIYKDTSFSTASGNLMVSTSDVYSKTYPDYAQLFSVKGDKLMESDFAQGTVSSSISRNATIAASIEYDLVHTVVTLHVWKGSQKLYSKEFQVHIPTENSLAISSDGSKIALLLTKVEFIDPKTTRLYYLDAATGKSLGEWSFDTGCRHLSISSHGERGAFHIGKNIILFDFQSGKVESTIDMKYSDYALGFSPNGEFLSFGFYTLYTYQRESSGKWTAISKIERPGEYFVGTVAMDNTGNQVVSWQAFNAKSFKIQYFKKGKTAAESTFSSSVSPSLQNPAYSVKITNDADFAAVGSWGEGVDSQVPELYVFNLQDVSKPVFTYKAAGSLFDVDIMKDGKNLRVACGSKIGHANKYGKGGELSVFTLNME